MTQPSNEKARVVVRIQPRDAQDDGQQAIWRRFGVFAKQLLTFGFWGGTRAAAAKVAQMEAQAQKAAAEAARTRARATAIELQNASRAIELVNKILRSKDSPETKRVELELLREADPKLASAIDRLLACYRSITSQGGSIEVDSEKSSSLPASPRRSRRTPDGGMKGRISESPPGEIP